MQDEVMNSTVDRFMMRNSIFAWIGLVTGCVLLVPLVAMQFSESVNWTAWDFVAMGTLMFVTGSLFVMAARKVPRKYRVAVGILFAGAFLYVWAELAVGVFTNLGS